MSFHAKDFAGSHCGCRYQQDYRPTLGRDGKKRVRHAGGHQVLL